MSCEQVVEGMVNYRAGSCYDRLIKLWFTEVHTSRRLRTMPYPS